MLGRQTALLVGEVWAVKGGGPAIGMAGGDCFPFHHAAKQVTYLHEGSRLSYLFAHCTNAPKLFRLKSLDAAA